MRKIFLCLLFVVACDFSSQLNKEILSIQHLVNNQNYEQAVHRYQKILNKNLSPELKIKVLFQLAEIHSLYLNENDKAITYYNKIIEIAENPIWLIKSQEKLGEIFYNYKKDFPKAKEIYESLMSFYPRLSKYEFYEFRYAQTLLKTGEFEKGINSLKRIQLDSSHSYFADSYYDAGLAFFYKKMWKEAAHNIKVFIQVEKRKDRVVNAKFILANIFETLGNLKESYNLYYSIIGEYPNSEVVKKRLESIYKRRVSRKR